MEERPFINRILISLITALSFVAMLLSGIAAFIVPQGKVAFWTNWTFLGLSKTQWGNIHITTSVLFLKDAATRLGVVPIEVLKTILVGEPM